MDQSQQDNKEDVTEILVTILNFYYKYKKKWKYIILFGILGVAVGGTIGFLKKPTFPTSSSLVIEGASAGGISSYLNIAKSFGFGESSKGNLLTPENFTEIGKSKRIVYTTLLTTVEVEGQSDLLINHYSKLVKPIIVETPDGNLDTVFIKNTIPFKGTLREEKIMGIIYNEIVKGAISINTSAENSIIKVNTSFQNEQLSHQFAKVYLKTIYDYFLNNMLNQEQEMLSLLREKKDSIVSTLSIKQRRYADLNDRTINVVKSRQSLEKLELMKDIEILNAMLATTIQSLEMTEFSARESKKIFKIIDEPVLPIPPVKKGMVFHGFLFGILFAAFKFGHMIIWTKFKKAKASI